VALPSVTSASIPSGARQPDLAEVGTLRPGGGAPRARLLVADVVVDDDGGQGDAAEVGQGVFDAPMDVKQLIEPWVQLWCW
jgi:hypothetical protein